MGQPRLQGRPLTAFPFEPRREPSDESLAGHAGRVKGREASAGATNSNRQPCARLNTDNACSTWHRRRLWISGSPPRCCEMIGWCVARVTGARKTPTAMTAIWVRERMAGNPVGRCQDCRSRRHRAQNLSRSHNIICRRPYRISAYIAHIRQNICLNIFHICTSA